MKFQYKVRRVPTAQYISQFLDTDLTRAACVNCPQFGKSWSCPPFDCDYVSKIKNTSEAIIVALRVEVSDIDSISSLDELNNKSLCARRETETRIRLWEKLYNGIAFTTIGKCNHCENETCARELNKECRHPELVRPSLESVGFNLIKTSEDLLGIPLRWNSSEGRQPLTLTFIFGFFRYI